ncbi:MAG: NYN domain-containing protein [Aestuariivirgaceae bacterium]
MAPTDPGSWGVMISSAFFIDGFNLYHALKRLGPHHLKWVDLNALMRRLVAAKSEDIVAYYYFSAFAYWLPEQWRRHQEYVAALTYVGVVPIMGQFKNKDRWCLKCGARWIGHEEKETDVNIALYLLNEAYRDTYDRAYVVSRDSDLKPAVELVLKQFPDKEIVIVAPPELGHSNDLTRAAGNKRTIKRRQVEVSLFPAIIVDSAGNVIATRPSKYDPPHRDRA